LLIDALIHHSHIAFFTRGFLAQSLHQSPIVSTEADRPQRHQTFTMGILRKASITRPEEAAGKSWPAIAMGFFVAFGGVLFGYVMPKAQPYQRFPASCHC
jgi:hypothetical protein